MIGSISGTVIHRNQNIAIIETNSGVGYRVATGQSLNIGQTVRLFTYHHIREDSSDLYGFIEMADLAIFELLLTVSGVGPKMALAISSTLGRETIVDGVANNQPAIFRSVSGVGQKVAEKIIVELKSKIGALPTSGSLGGPANSELFEALVQFGYNQTEISTVLKEIDASLSMPERLKQALRLLGK
jgi:holliday junction DNA helicase RuvA